MWFKQGISLDNSNFDMENYYSLVDVKLLLKRILDSYWNKLLCKFCITVRRFHARAQSSTCVTKCNNGRANSEISYTTDCLYNFRDRQKLNSACCNYVHFFHQPLISVTQKISFPKSTEQWWSNDAQIYNFYAHQPRWWWLQMKGLKKDLRNFVILDYWKCDYLEM